MGEDDRRLDGLKVATPTAGALAQARRRIGVAPLRALFDLLRGPAAGPATKGVYWRGLLVTAIDGTMMCRADTAANLRTFCRGGGHHGGTGYPMIRVLALLACATRTIIDATFATTGIRETTYTRDLLRATHRGMIVLADRNFAAQALIAAIADTGAELLTRVKNGRELRSAANCATVRMCRASARSRSASSPARSPSPPAQDTRPGSTGWSPPSWIPTAPPTRSSRSPRPVGDRDRVPATQTDHPRRPGTARPHPDQQIYALLITYQALRTAITDATIGRPDVDPDRGSFTITLNTARDQLVNAAGVIADTVIDLVGTIGRHVLDNLMPNRRLQTNPRVVTRAISKLVTSSAQGRIRAPSYKATISIDILAPNDP